MIRIPLIVLIIHTCVQAWSQDTDTTEFKKLDIFPAISYSPETKLTLGVIGFRHLDLGKDGITRRSNVRFLALYTTANQLAIETGWNLFTAKNKWWMKGELGFIIFPDRNYGLGNDASALIYEYDKKKGQVADSTIQNYARYDIYRMRFLPTFLYSFKPGFFAGPSLEMEYSWNHEFLGDSIQFVENTTSVMELADNIQGLRSGLGFQVVYDTRDNLLNCWNGSYVELKNMYYGPYLGSDYNYVSIDLDARTYIRTGSNHTLALRSLIRSRIVNSEFIPMQDLARLGGSDFMRGYYQGTYQDENGIGFQAEYRLPFFNYEDSHQRLNFVQRLGMTAFLSAGQVYGKVRSFGFDQFNYAGGIGLRILMNPESRVNLRVDYAFGFSADSDGPGFRQTGLYFNLAEVF